MGRTENEIGFGHAVANPATDLGVRHTFFGPLADLLPYGWISHRFAHARDELGQHLRRVPRSGLHCGHTLRSAAGTAVIEMPLETMEPFSVPPSVKPLMLLLCVWPAGPTNRAFSDIASINPDQPGLPGRRRNAPPPRAARAKSRSFLCCSASYRCFPAEPNLARLDPCWLRGLSCP